MKAVSTRQLCILIMLAGIGFKFLFLPSLAYYNCENDAYIGVFLMLLLEVATYSIYFYLMSKNSELSFKEILEKMFGKIFAKVLLIGYFLLFLMKSLTVLQSKYVFLVETLYQEFDWVVFVVTLLATLGFVATKKLNVIARLAGSFFFVSLLAVAIPLYVGVIKADFTNLIPVLENGLVDAVKIFDYAMWFGDSLLMLLVFGNIRKSKHFYIKTYASMIVSILAAVSFFMIFYSLYGPSSITHRNAIADVLDVLPFSSDLGRLSWIIVLLWHFALFVATSVLFYLAVTMFDTVFPTPKRLGGIILSCVAIFVGVYFLRFDLGEIIKLNTQYGKYYAAFFQYGMPIMFLIFSFRIKKERTKE